MENNLTDVGSVERQAVEEWTKSGGMEEEALKPCRPPVIPVSELSVPSNSPHPQLTPPPPALHVY